MARHLLAVLPLLLCASLYFTHATAQESAPPSPEAYDVNTELEKLKGWKAYLLAEVDKYKAEVEKAQTALQAEQQRTAELTSLVEQWKQASTAAEAKAANAEAKAADAEAKAAAAEARAAAAEAKAAEGTHFSAQVEQLQRDAVAAQAKVAEAEVKAAEAAKKAAEAEALAASHAQYHTQMSAQVEKLKQDLAAAESRISAHAASADASNGEAALLRKQLADAVAERQALDDRITELASAATKAGGLRGHALAIYNILLEEVARHHENALNYANEKLPGFKAKVAEVHATFSSQMPNVTGHVGKFVNNVDGELRPWLRQTLGSVPALKPYSEDPVVLQGLVYFVIGAPVLLLLLPLLSIIFRWVDGWHHIVVPTTTITTTAEQQQHPGKLVGMRSSPAIFFATTDVAIDNASGGSAHGALSPDDQPTRPLRPSISLHGGQQQQQDERLQPWESVDSPV
ncbi:hypothetical protein VOLCADRAFT_105088 [Volvox carteri f. nagariensis]|uniref:Uncharacterized protein n=1 Tax=Volvox carteri f. nagariensis TaxID=3068 RepID=D8TYC2_VOLCA|nr:uncharacterized protein VOLCADRAFT_105088 [Volvox carteri f. nagariensis]EFJ47527.1 hypothetical protein VOLCADRAFT_105088 [Volvox carteri f. nagariensis]|eukprot:XP_002951351.1 hypothetical protein VOLCADRAFT_105088 [Volvox carteri f. nagariensis]